MSIKKVMIIVLCGILVFATLAGCAGEGVGSSTLDLNAPGDGEPEAAPTAIPESPTPETSNPEKENTSKEKTEESDMNTIQATITMEDGGIIVLELYEDIAPQSVRNFVSLARQGYYDGLKFHRIIKGFMIQGGCPKGNGTGGPGYSIFGEFSQNGWENNLSHKRGVVSMARSNMPDSAGSQFFIVHKDSTFLDGAYAAFGKVTSGMDVVDKLADTPVSGDNGEVAANNMPVIKTITIDTDVELPEPNKL